MEHLSDIEIITGILGNADVARELLLATEGLRKLRKMSAEEMMNLNVTGMGHSRIQRLIMSFALATRLSGMMPETPEIISSPRYAAALFMEQLRYKKKEYFMVLLLNTKNHVVSKEEISIGSLNASIVHPRDIFNVAIRKNAAQIILVHNHPSGDPWPGNEDKIVTKRMIESGKLLGIPIIDHIIIGDGQFTSFKEIGLMGVLCNEEGC